MPTNQLLPAIVCLSMIVSGCANQELFDNWNNVTDGSISNPDGKASDLSTCDGPCPLPPVWSEDFSNGLFLNSNSDKSAWKTAKAAWVLEHTSDPVGDRTDLSKPRVSWSLCDRDTNNTVKCPTDLKPSKLSFVSFGGMELGSYSAVAFFYNVETVKHLTTTFLPVPVKCDPRTVPNCNLDMNPETNASSEISISTVPNNTVIKKYLCTSAKCTVSEESSLSNPESVQGIRITYSKRGSSGNYKYLNFAVDSLTLTGTYGN